MVPMKLKQYEQRLKPGRVACPPGAEAVLVLLGTGNPYPDPNRNGPASAIVKGERALLFDCGEGIWRGLAAAATLHGGHIEKAFRAPGLTHLFLTHLHPDHIAGLISFMLQPWVMGRKERIRVFGPVGTRTLIEGLENAVLDVTRFDTDRGFNDLGWRSEIFEFSRDGIIFEDADFKVAAIRTPHDGVPENFAFSVLSGGRSFVIGGDGRTCPTLAAAAKGVDVLLHEVVSEATAHMHHHGDVLTIRDPATVENRMKRIFSQHCSPRVLAEMIAQACPASVVLYHEQNYSDPFDPDICLKELRAAGYAGPLYLAEDGDVF